LTDNCVRENIVPEGAVCFGKCPKCGEEDWLFKWEGADPWCETCIDDAHDAMHDAEDAVAEAQEAINDPEAFDDDPDFGGDMEFDYP
jgi:hypothetical protein